MAVTLEWVIWNTPPKYNWNILKTTVKQRQCSNILEISWMMSVIWHNHHKWCVFFTSIYLHPDHKKTKTHEHPYKKSCPRFFRSWPFLGAWFVTWNQGWKRDTPFGVSIRVTNGRSWCCCWFLMFGLLPIAPKLPFCPNKINCINGKHDFPFLHSLWIRWSPRVFFWGSGSIPPVGDASSEKVTWVTVFFQSREEKKGSSQSHICSMYGIYLLICIYAIWE